MTFQQTDVNSVNVAAYCSGASTNTNGTSSSVATVGGSAGSSDHVETMDSSASNLLAVFFEVLVTAGSTWGAGNWTVPMNITAANSFISWDATYICRLNSAYVNQETIGSVTAQHTSLGSTGVVSHIVSGAAVTPAVGDLVGIVMLFSNASTMSVQPFTWRSSEIITAAGFTAGGGGGGTNSGFSMRSDIPNPFVGPMALRQAWRQQPIQDIRLAAITDTNFGPLNRGFPNPRVGPVVLRQRWRGVSPSIVTPPPAVGANGDALWRMRFVRPPVHSINRNLPEDFVYG